MRYGVTINRLISKISSDDWFSKNDLFVVVKYKDQRRRTSVVWDANEPVWNESFLFDINMNDDEPLLFTICDEDVYSKSEKLIEEKLYLNLNKEKQELTAHLSITHGIINYDLMDRNLNLTTKLEEKELECSKMKTIISSLNTAMDNIGEIQRNCNKNINKE